MVAHGLLYLTGRQPAVLSMTCSQLKRPCQPYVHSELRERFAEENIFLEVIDALLGIVGSSTNAERKRAAHHVEGYFIENSKLWKLGGVTRTCAVSCRECVMK